MNSFLRDCRYALRSMRRSPGFSLVALLTITLGIGMNTVVFTVVNAVLLRDLPYPKANRLVVVHWKNKYGRLGDDLSIPAFHFLNGHATSFSSLALIDPSNAGANLSSADGSSYVKVLRASNGFFETLGVNPLTGATFSHGSAAAPIAVLSHAIWKQQFGGDEKVIGRTISVNGQSYAISGVMPRDFHSYPASDVWVPLNIGALEGGDPQANKFRLIGRIKPNVTVEQAQDELDRVADQFRSLYGLQNARDNLGFLVESYHDYVAGNLQSSLVILSISVFLVLLIACANLAAMLLARGSARSNELALRVALGASRLSLFRLAMTETLIWAALGAVAGLLLASFSVPLLIENSPGQIQRASEIHIDGSVIVFTVFASLFTAFICSLGPVLSVMRADPKARLQSNSQGSAGPRQLRLTRFLVGAQVALSTVLLAGAGLLLLTFLKTRTISPGFVPDRLTVFQLALSDSTYQGTTQTEQLTGRILERLSALPGASSAAWVAGMPTQRGMNVAARSLTPGGPDLMSVEYRPITKDYFPAMGIPLVAGRGFSMSDTSKSPAVVVVNQSLARRWWPNQSPIGQMIATSEGGGSGFAASNENTRQVIAICGDVHEAGLDQPAPLIVYLPLSQVPEGMTPMINKTVLGSFLVRSKSKEGALDTEARDIVRSIDPRLPIASIQPANEILHASLSNRKFYAFMIGIFSIFAIFLTGVGLFGILSFQLSQRAREIAIRMALGSTRQTVLVLVLRQGLSIVLIGLGLGFAGTMAVTRLISSLLYQTSPYDPAAIALTGLLVLVVGFLASWIPALRASGTDPATIFRSQ